MKTRFWRALVAFSLIAGVLTISAGALGASTAPGQYIVVLQDGVADPATTADHLLRGTGQKADRLYRHALRGFAARIPDAKLAQIAADPRVAFVEPVQVVQIHAQEVPTGIDRIDFDANPTLGGGVDTDVDIAIIDTGIDLDHEDLNVVASTQCEGNRRATCTDGEGDDDHGHGTHVAGTAAAKDNDVGVIGVAPGARLWAVKVLDAFGFGTTAEVTAGIDWVAEHAGEIDVANMSLGGEFVSPAMDAALDGAIEAGVFFAVSAGNDSRDVVDFSPANHPLVTTVSAITDYDGQPGGLVNPTCFDWGPDDTLANFSNFGEGVEIAAPGGCIYSTYAGNSYATISGTSMASPHVAGAAALWIAKNGPDTPANIQAALLAEAVPQDDDCGFTGDVDAFAEPLLYVNSAGFGGTAACGSGGGGGNTSPTASWSTPSDGATVSGTVTVQIDADDAEDAVGTLTVEFQVDGGAWQAAAYNGATGFYEAGWDTTGGADGSTDLTARATDSEGAEGTGSITVTVDNDPGGGGDGVHVSNIDLSLNGAGNKVNATVTVVDQDGTPVAGATVTGTFTDIRTTTSRASGSNGNVRLSSGRASLSSGDVVEFCVDDISHDTLAYDPAANVETCDTIVVP